jgi:hypothetical protein
MTGASPAVMADTGYIPRNGGILARAADRARSILPRQSKNLNTETTEDHGGPRRSFGLSRHALTPGASTWPGRPIVATAAGRLHLLCNETFALRRRWTFGPVSPWSSMVLRGLRFKISRCSARKPGLALWTGQTRQSATATTKHAPRVTGVRDQATGAP